MGAAVAMLAQTRSWSVDRHVSYDGSMMVLAEHDATGKVFTLSGAGSRIELNRVYEDMLMPYGEFERPEAVLRVLAAALKGL